MKNLCANVSKRVTRVTQKVRLTMHSCAVDFYFPGHFVGAAALGYHSPAVYGFSWFVITDE